LSSNVGKGTNSNSLKITQDCTKIRAEIQAFLDAGKRVNHKEISSKLGIPPTTYWKRVAKIYAAAEEAFAEEAKSTVMSRTLRIRDALEFMSTINYEIANNPENAPRDRREASEAYFTAELWRYQLDTHGPELPKLQDYVEDNVEIKEL
jgi:hypothetical protein